MAELVCDVAVVGGGPAGATAALVLARAGHRVALIEAAGYDRPRVGETLPPSAQPLLAELGVWDAVVRLGLVPSYGNHSAWGSDVVSVQPFIFSPYGNGWHVDRRRFDAVLASQATAAGARAIHGRRITACGAQPDGSWRLILTGERSSGRGPQIIAQAIIEATGRRAALASSLGARRRIHDRLVGIAMEYRGCAGDGSHTLVEAVQDGWWYSVPIPGQRTMVLFMTDADLCHAQRHGDTKVWRTRLMQTLHTSRRATGLEPAWGPSVFSAVSHRLERLDAPGRWLAAGDAAMGVDPLSSGGIVRALTTGRAAAHAIAHWLQGRPSAAQAYERGLDAAFSAYWSERAAYYQLERRWPDTAFWRRRLAPISTPAIPRAEATASPS